MLTYCCVTGNGKVEYGEFRNFMLRQYKEQDGNLDSEKQIRQAFKVFDRDNNGYIDKNELRYLQNNPLKGLLSDSSRTPLRKHARAIHNDFSQL